MFNPHARWDRDLPAEAAGSSEPVEVYARFSGGRVTPIHFTVSGTRFPIQKINYSWQERKGTVLLRYFSVADKSNTYCLCLDTETMSWRLLHTE